MGDRRQRLETRIVRQLALAVGLLAVVLLQTGLLPRPLGAPPNMLLIGVVCWAALSGADQAAICALYGGIWLDLLSGTMVGAHTLTLLLTVGLTAAIVRAFDHENWLLPLSAVAASTLLFHLALILGTGGAGNWVNFGIVVLLPALFSNAILTLPIYLGLGWWNNRGRSRLEW